MKPISQQQLFDTMQKILYDLLVNNNIITDDELDVFLTLLNNNHQTPPDKTSHPQYVCSILGMFMTPLAILPMPDFTPYHLHALNDFVFNQKSGIMQINSDDSISLLKQPEFNSISWSVERFIEMWDKIMQGPIPANIDLKVILLFCRISFMMRITTDTWPIYTKWLDNDGSFIKGMIFMAKQLSPATSIDALNYFVSIACGLIVLSSSIMQNGITQHHIHHSAQPNYISANVSINISGMETECIPHLTGTNELYISAFDCNIFNAVQRHPNTVINVVIDKFQLEEIKSKPMYTMIKTTHSLKPSIYYNVINGLKLDNTTVISYPSDKYIKNILKAPNVYIVIIKGDDHFIYIDQPYINILDIGLNLQPMMSFIHSKEVSEYLVSLYKHLKGGIKHAMTNIFIMGYYKQCMLGHLLDEIHWTLAIPPTLFSAPFLQSNANNVAIQTGLTDYNIHDGEFNCEPEDDPGVYASDFVVSINESAVPPTIISAYLILHPDATAINIIRLYKSRRNLQIACPYASIIINKLKELKHIID